MVPNGLDGIARNHTDSNASEAALEELLAMWEDPSRTVRGEVLESLGRIVGRLQSSGRHPLSPKQALLTRRLEEWHRAWK